MTDIVSIKGLAKADVLAALYNNSKAQGMGFLHFDATSMSKDDAETLLAQTTKFDYLQGRVLKVDLTTDELKTWLYNRDLGQGAAERIIRQLRDSQASQQPNIA